MSVPYAWRGLLVAVFFGFARAAGETMAVQMVIGGARQLAAGSLLLADDDDLRADRHGHAGGAARDRCENDVLYSMALVLLVVSVSVVLVTRILARSQAPMSAVPSRCT